jgi:hypothetical protein
MVSRIIIITLLASILGVLTVTLVVPMVQERLQQDQDAKNLHSFIEDAKKHGY